MRKSTRSREPWQSPPAALVLAVPMRGGSRLLATVPPPPALPPLLSAFCGPKRELSDDAGADRELCPFAQGAPAAAAPACGREGWADDCRTDDGIGMLCSLGLIGVGLLLGWLTSGIFSAIWSGLKALWRLL